MLALIPIISACLIIILSHRRERQFAGQIAHKKASVRNQTDVRLNSTIPGACKSSYGVATCTLPLD